VIGQDARVGLGRWQGRAVILSVLAAAIAYLGFSIWSGWAHVVHAIVRVGGSGMAVLLMLSLGNYAFRFLRWQTLLRSLGHRVPIVASLRIYLAGFALTTTPGKTGEAIRGVFLRPLGVPYPATMAAFTGERLSDLLALVLLAIVCLPAHPELRVAILVAFVGSAGAAILIGPLLLRAVLRYASGRGRSHRLARAGAELLREIGRCHAPRTVLISAACSMAAWTAEAYALALLVGWLGFHCPVSYAMFVYAAAMVSGALSMLPGGLGGTEAVMSATLIGGGMAPADAVAATIAIRLCTLWFAVALGALALTAQNRTERRVSPRRGAAVALG
jgi:uncharacterized membrane protein YbhN (UPF0104 family)